MNFDTCVGLGERHQKQYIELVRHPRRHILPYAPQLLICSLNIWLCLYDKTIDSFLWLWQQMTANGLIHFTATSGSHLPSYCLFCCCFLRERKGREGEKHQCMVASTGGLACNPGMGPD